MLYIFYRTNSEHERSVEEFQRLLEQRHLRVELIDVDSRQGAAKAQTYGVMQHPTVLAVRDGDGQMLQIWPGIIPTVSDAEYYARSSL